MGSKIKFKMRLSEKINRVCKLNWINKRHLNAFKLTTRLNEIKQPFFFPGNFLYNLFLYDLCNRDFGFTWSFNL